MVRNESGSVTFTVGGRPVTVKAGPGGASFAYTELQGTRTNVCLSYGETVELVAYLAEELPVFSTDTFESVVADVAAFQGRVAKNAKVQSLMETMSRTYFSKDLHKLSSIQYALIRDAAEAKVDLAEAEAKLK